MDLGEDLISCLCLGVKSRALVLNAMAQNLDALNVWWLGVFIAPTTKLAVWWWLIVVWCTGQSSAHRTCPVRQPRHQAVEIRPLKLLTSGPAWLPVYTGQVL